MNVLIIGKFYPEGFAEHIAETLADMGHVPHRYESGPGYTLTSNRWLRRGNQLVAAAHAFYSKTAIYQGRSTKQLLAFVAGKEIGLTIVCYDFLTPFQVAELRRVTRSPVVLWFPDAVSNFRGMMFLAAPYDALFFKEPFAVRIIREELGRNAFYLPECCNPRYHRPLAVTAEEQMRYGCEISTAGNLHAARVAFFSQLTDYDVKIWGPGSPTWLDTTVISKMIQHHFVANEEKSKCFVSSKIVINNLHPAEVFGTNVRTFEVAATGSFQLVSWRPGLSQLFVENEEIVAFRGMSDLKQKIDHFLVNDAERRRIGLNGQRRTLGEHTYEKRLQLLLQTTFDGARGFPMSDEYVF